MVSVSVINCKLRELGDVMKVWKLSSKDAMYDGTYRTSTNKLPLNIFLINEDPIDDDDD